jgi:hypothetical protein
LWIDESIHFVLTGQQSLGDLLLRLNNPDAGFLTRQTGFYQVLNYLTLQVTGANWIALRAPSIASGAVLIWATYVFLSNRHATRAYQLMGLVLLATQSGLLYYVGEARPYLPYAATSLGVLAYLTAGDSHQSRRSVQWLGWASLVFGALFHLYFLLVLPLIILFSVWYQVFSRQLRPSWRSFMKFSKPIPVGCSVALALILGTVTWMRPQQPNRLDPFAWTGGSWDSFLDVTTSFHLDLVQTSALRTVFIFAETFLLIFLILSRKYRIHRDLFASAILIGVGGITSAIIAGSSIFNGYAVATRQLVLGPALIALALAWQLFAVRTSMGVGRLRPAQVAVAATIGILCGTALLEVGLRVQSIPTSALVLFAVTSAAVSVAFQGRTGKQLPRLAIASMTASATMVSSLAMPPRLAPHQQTAVAALVIAFSLLASITYSHVRQEHLQFRRIFTVLVCVAVLTSGLTGLLGRVDKVKNELFEFHQLSAEVESMGPAGIDRMRNESERFLRDANPKYGTNWVYMSNVNSVSGGPVWHIFSWL